MVDYVRVEENSDNIYTVIKSFLGYTFVLGLLWIGLQYIWIIL